jgi:hypothetical protein
MCAQLVNLPIQTLIDYEQTKLPKFVQINWCGDGVPEAKKGLFHTHSTAVSRFFRGTHVVMSARNEVRHLSHPHRILLI